MISSRDATAIRFLVGMILSLIVVAGALCLFWRSHSFCGGLEGLVYFWWVELATFLTLFRDVAPQYRDECETRGVPFPGSLRGSRNKGQRRSV